jgi:hypothetical protein
MKGWHWFALWLVCAIGVWALPKGYLYPSVWFLAWSGVFVALRRWDQRRSRQAAR